MIATIPRVLNPTPNYYPVHQFFSTTTHYHFMFSSNDNIPAITKTNHTGLFTPCPSPIYIYIYIYIYSLQQKTSVGQISQRAKEINLAD